MTLVSGLQDMKTIKIKIITSLTLLIFVVLLIIGVDLTAKEAENQQADLEDKVKVIIDTKTGDKNKESAEEPTTFTPTEEVSADQAVAFPSDI